MGVFQHILTGEKDVVYECRSCGKTLEGEEATCPYCGDTDVVCYEIS